MKIGDPTAELVVVPSTGMGCTLIRRAVLEAMPAPWFEHTKPGWGEDWVFCEKAKALGYDIHVDTAVLPGHVEVRAVTLVDAGAYWKTHPSPPKHSVEATADVAAVNEALERMRSKRAAVAN